VLDITGLTKSFLVPDGQVVAICGLNLVVEEGKFFVLLGPSGCGKSTLLRCTAGLEHPQEGEIFLGGKCMTSIRNGVLVDPEDREIAMVFQSYAVWPHMTVFDNVAFPLVEAKQRRLARGLVNEKVKEALALVRLSGLERHSAATLSGGQQQRVALARALVREPQLLLMDEPLSNLDAKLREEMRDEIKDLTRSLGVTTLHVTHDQTEALALADVMAVMHEGKILEVGHPETIYRNPSDRTVAEFLGRTNWLIGVVSDDGSVKTGTGVVRCSLPGGAKTGTTVRLGVRPEWIELGLEPCQRPNSFHGKIDARMFLGDTVLYWVKVGQFRFMVKSAFQNFAVGQLVYVMAPPDSWVAFRDQP
jgi:iron(III) transport system ATP-binding protein